MDTSIFYRIDVYDNHHGTLIGFYREFNDIIMDLRPSDLDFHKLLESGNYVQLTEFLANPELFETNPLLAWAEGEEVAIYLFNYEE